MSHHQTSPPLGRPQHCAPIDAEAFPTVGRFLSSGLATHIIQIAGGVGSKTSPLTRPAKTNLVADAAQLPYFCGLNVGRNHKGAAAAATTVTAVPSAAQRLPPP